MNRHALEVLEFPRVIADVALQAECDAARVALCHAAPIADSVRRATEIARLGEAIRRGREPGAWLHVGREAVRSRLLDHEGRGLDAAALIAVGTWLEAAAHTRAAWQAADLALRHPLLHDMVQGLPALDSLRERLSLSFEPDGRVSDRASPSLKRARAALAAGEREQEQRLERWARGFGAETYVTRYGDRFVAMVPAAGFPRRRGIVHDVSGSGQSLFVEPLEACDANNRLIELRATVTEEEQRVIRELTAAVLDATEPLVALEQTLVDLDGLRARARWANEHGGMALAPHGDVLRLVNARHPLLAVTLETVVPLDIALDRQNALLLVSGPNMGGKTILLKTVGVSVALAHAAFPVLAGEGSTVPEIDFLEADLGDEQSIDRGLSTFAAHLETLGAMARVAGPRTLLLCDELGAGTDPEEGAPLGRALLEHFAARGAWGIVTTHLGALKLLAGSVAGIVNGSLEIDAVAMAPTYRFIPGVPGASHALAMAERLGFDASVLTRARGYVRAESATLERVLADLQSLRRRLDDQLIELARARDEADAAAADHRAASEAARQELDRVTRTLGRESDVLLSHARELWQTVQREARRADKTRADAAMLKAQIDAVEREQEAVRSRGAAAYGALGVEPGGGGAGRLPARITPGLRVRVADLGVIAEVAEAPDAEGNVRLKRGGWTIQSHVSKLAAIEGAAGTEAPRDESHRPPRSSQAPLATWEASEAVPLEVDLRGQEVDEALHALDQALDRAVLGGLTELRVIHGVGKGVLRVAVERHVRGHPQVGGARMGQVGEGGRGVTVVKLR